jgi:hypothetical protein
VVVGEPAAVEGVVVVTAGGVVAEGGVGVAGVAARGTDANIGSVDMRLSPRTSTAMRSGVVDGVCGLPSGRSPVAAGEPTDVAASGPSTAVHPVRLHHQDRSSEKDPEPEASQQDAVPETPT